MTSFWKLQLFLLLPNVGIYLFKFSLPVLLGYSIRYSIEYSNSKLLKSGSPNHNVNIKVSPNSLLAEECRCLHFVI